jgi:mannose-1-phosphate guanylyltransferase
MAGGSGTRFWPESRNGRPKQLLRIAGEETMIQATVDRLGDLVPPERTFVATTAVLAGPIAEQLGELPREAILVEPCKRDTAPCIGLAAIRIVRDDPDAVMAVMPSDHVIAPAEAFREAIRFAAALVDEQPRRMVTFGITPTYPAESFGYIERGELLPTGAASSADRPAGAYRVKKFHEKPKADVAGRYVASGTFYWNSGIFVWRAQTILDAIAEHRPTMFEHLRRIAEAAGVHFTAKTQLQKTQPGAAVLQDTQPGAAVLQDTQPGAAVPHFDEVLHREFAAIEPISIDLGVMEHADDVVVIEAPFDWDDVGSWRALERLRAADGDGNVVDAARHLLLDTAGTIVRSTDPAHVVVTVGVKDLIVIVTPDATLVADKRNEESIRQVTRQLEERGWTEYL